jgi:hypothetical protein
MVYDMIYGFIPAGSAGAGPFTPKPPFWERPTFFIWPAASADPAAEEARFAAEDPGNFAGVKKDMDRSRGTLTRTGKLCYLSTFVFLGQYSWQQSRFAMLRRCPHNGAGVGDKKDMDRSRGTVTRTGALCYVCTCCCLVL